MYIQLSADPNNYSTPVHETDIIEPFGQQLGTEDTAWTNFVPGTPDASLFAVTGIQCVGEGEEKGERKKLERKCFKGGREENMKNFMKRRGGHVPDQVLFYFSFVSFFSFAGVVAAQGVPRVAELQLRLPAAPPPARPRLPLVCLPCLPQACQLIALRCFVVVVSPRGFGPQGTPSTPRRRATKGWKTVTFFCLGAESSITPIPNQNYYCRLEKKTIWK